MVTLNLVGSSAKFRALLDNVDLVAPVTLPSSFREKLAPARK